MNRTKKALRNVATGLLNKLVLFFMAFATRTVFIRLLGAEYTGINSLYTNILSVLSVAELGLGNVMMFYLYGALREKDEARINYIVFYFRRIYLVIIAVVLGFGCLLIPFLGLIVKTDAFSYYEIASFYLFYLVNAVASYFVIFRTMTLQADQKNYICNLCTTISSVAMYLIQMVYLLIWRDFYGFLAIQVLSTVINNCVQNQIAKRHYPYLKQRIHDGRSYLSGKEVFRDIKATFLFKVADTVLDQTDNIIISIMFGTVFVGYYTNYYMIVFYLVSIVSILVNGLIAGFGSLNAEKNMERSHEMFRCSMFMFSFIGCLCATVYLCVIQDFVTVWIGSEFLMPYDLVLAVLAVFFLRMCTNTVWIYRSTMGLFQSVQYINIIAAALNIVLSVLLGMVWGIAGVIAATAISRLLTSFWYEAKVVYHKFHKNVREYFGLQLKSFLLFIGAAGISFAACLMIQMNPWVNIILKSGICCVTVILSQWLFYRHTVEYAVLKSHLTGNGRIGKKIARVFKKKKK